MRFLKKPIEITVLLADRKVSSTPEKPAGNFSEFLKHPAALIVITSLVTSLLVPSVTYILSEMNAQQKRYQDYVTARGELNAAVGSYISQAEIGDSPDFPRSDRFRLSLQTISVVRRSVQQLRITNEKDNIPALEKFDVVEDLLKKVETNIFVVFTEATRLTPTPNSNRTKDAIAALKAALLELRKI